MDKIYEALQEFFTGTMDSLIVEEAIALEDEQMSLLGFERVEDGWLVSREKALAILKGPDYTEYWKTETDRWIGTS